MRAEDGLPPQPECSGCPMALDRASVAREHDGLDLTLTERSSMLRHSRLQTSSLSGLSPPT